MAVTLRQVVQSEASFSFIHAADLHLDSPFIGVRADAPFVADALCDASLNTYRAIIDLALSRKVDFVLFAGDIYDGADRGIRAQTQFRDGLKQLSDEGIQSFIVHGNHDPLESGWSAIANSFPTGTTIFPTEKTATVEIVRDGERIATVQGISYRERATTDNLALRFRRPEGSGIHIGLLHCNVGGSANGHSNYSPCTLDDLRATGLDYLALGHVHTRGILAGGGGSGDPWIVYPGNAQSRNINEGGAKGVYVVEVHGGVINDPEFVACDEVRFIREEINIEECESLIDIVDRFEQRGAELLEMNTPRSIIIRGTLTGRSPLHQELVAQDAVEDLLDAIREKTRRYQPFCWWDQIADASSSPFDIEEIRQRHDFAADLVATSEASATDPSANEEIVQELIANMPKQFRRDLEEVLSDQEFVTQLIANAQLRALDAIVDLP